MDVTCNTIAFDNDGVCNFCREYERDWRVRKESGKYSSENMEKILDTIRKAGKGKEFDCVCGVSGGVDSSYIALLAKRHGLRALCVHVDNGWDTVIANRNIERLVKRLDFTLHTDVLDWEEFRDIQRAFFRASVVDIELITDQALFSCIFKAAADNDVKYVLGGYNPTSEASCFMPPGWNHTKMDALNLLDIHRRFGAIPMKTYPLMDPYTYRLYRFRLGVETVNLLEYMDFNHASAIEELQEELGWESYGGKHCESMFTKYYQSHVLPVKFNMDKRKVHYSNMIMAGEMTRSEALERLAAPPYDTKELARDTAYVIKKLGYTREEFDAIMAEPPRPHSDYYTDSEPPRNPVSED